MSSNPTVIEMNKNRTDHVARVQEMYDNARIRTAKVLQDKLAAHSTLLGEIDQLEKTIVESHTEMAAVAVRLEVAKKLVRAYTRDIKEIQDIIDANRANRHVMSQQADALVEEVESVQLPVRQPRRRQRREHNSMEEFEATIDQNTQPMAGEGAAAEPEVKTEEVKEEDDDDDAPFTQLIARELSKTITDDTKPGPAVPPKPRPPYKLPHTQRNKLKY